MAPNFTLKTLSGDPLCLSEHLGKKPVLLVFWSYFCFPCQREMPALQEYLREMGPDALEVVGICLDGPQFADRLLPYAQQNAITFPLVYDRETADFFEVAERYGVVGTPTSFLLDATGRIRLVHLGRVDRDLLAAGIKAAREQSFCAEITKPTPPAPAPGSPAAD